MSHSELWGSVSDALLDGLHHHLNNRAGTVAGLVQVIGAGGARAEVAEALSAELERMHRAIALVAELPRSGSAPPEVLLVQDAVRTAMEAYALHPLGRDHPCRLQTSSDLPPVRVDRMALGRSLLLMMLAAARAAAGEVGGEVRIRCRSDGDRITVETGVAGSSGDAPAVGAEGEERAIADWLAPSGGRVHRHSASSLVLSLPSLASAG